MPMPDEVTKARAAFLARLIYTALQHETTLVQALVFSTMFMRFNFSIAHSPAQGIKALEAILDDAKDGGEELWKRCHGG